MPSKESGPKPIDNHMTSDYSIIVLRVYKEKAPRELYIVKATGSDDSSPDLRLSLRKYIMAHHKNDIIDLQEALGYINKAI